MPGLEGPALFCSDCRIRCSDCWLTVPIQEPSTANLFIEMLLNAACADIRAMSEEVLRGCRELTPIGDSTKQKERITRAALPLPANNSGHNIQIASTGGG
ncbi:MAG: hypothetical protein QOH31_4259 [Verrucomicrobiota bacterium]